MTHLNVISTSMQKAKKRRQKAKKIMYLQFLIRAFNNER